MYLVDHDMSQSFASYDLILSQITLAVLHKTHNYVTGFLKRGLPHTSNSINLEDHNLVIKRHTKLKLSPAIIYPSMLVLPADQISSR